nr:cysteine-rich repeat secretory protein 55-like [Ipomoea batatas]
MALLRHLLLLASFCCTIFTAQSTDPSGLFCNTASKNLNSQTSTNILKLLTNLVPAASKAGYATAAYGGSGNKIYGLGQCRGDVSSKDCSSCIQEAAKEIRKRCPDRVDARIWYEYCFLRYTDEEFFGEVDTGYGILYANVANVTVPIRARLLASLGPGLKARDERTHRWPCIFLRVQALLALPHLASSFNKKLGNLVDGISKEAVVPENRGLGKGKTKLSDFLTLYALVQCTRDLSPVNCAQCLAIAVGNNFPGFCNEKKGCRVLYSSCYVRYELYPFYFPLDPPGKSTGAGWEARNYRSTVVHKRS